MKKTYLVSLMSFLTTFVWMSVAFAADKTTGGSGVSWHWAAALGSGIGLGIAAFGGALAQGRTASAALEGLARNPGAREQVFLPMIIGLALIESLVIYSFVISILLWLKL